VAREHEAAGVPSRTLLWTCGTGLVLSLYLARMHYYLYGHATYHKFLCDVSALFDCSYVVSSPWSEVLPGIPVAGPAAGLFLGLLLLNVLFRGSQAGPGLAAGCLLSVAAVVVCLVYLGIMVLVIRHGCLLCLALDAIVLWTAGLYLWNFERWQVFRGTGLLEAIGGLALVAVCLAGTTMTLKLLLQRTLHQQVADMIAAIEYTTPTPLPFAASSAAPVTLYVFSDLQCPACREGFGTLLKVQEIYGPKLHVVYKNYPLDWACNPHLPRASHPGSCAAARVAISAGLRGRYAAVAGQLIATSGDLAATLTRLEADPQIRAGLEPATAVLAADIQDGTTVGVERLPTYFLNGRKIEGPQPLPVWTAVLDELLGSASHAGR